VRDAAKANRFWGPFCESVEAGHLSSKGVGVKTVYVAELADGDDLLNEPFLLEDVVRRETRDGRPFLLSTFRDRTGQIGGVFWDVPEDVEGWIRPGIVTLVTGRVNNYKNTLQINATDLNPLLAPNMEQFLPASGRASEEMVAELRATIAELDEPWRGLVGRLLLAPAFLPKFASAPAARILHHAYIGGLLEHTMSMVALGRFMAAHYPHVNRSLLIAGLLLHDVGKTAEYDTQTSFSFSEDGRLVGHIARAVILIEQAASELTALSDEDLRPLIHIILSHHGSLEWGSPVTPKTLEAILAHQIDLLDSRVQGFFDHLRADVGSDRWSSRPSLMFSSDLLRPPGFE
jgi:3'-5' exoribonuclease